MKDTLAELQDGRPVVLATDTVFGIAALAGSPGCQKIYELKQRPLGQPLPWLIADASWLQRYGADIPSYAIALAKMFWPGALTLVVRASDEARAIGGVAQDGTVALRVPDSSVCLGLLQELDKPLACTSANIHGEPACTHVQDLPSSMRPLATLGDACSGGLASTIVDCTGDFAVIIREGAIPAHVVLQVAALLADE